MYSAARGSAGLLVSATDLSLGFGDAFPGLANPPLLLGPLTVLFALSTIQLKERGRCVAADFGLAGDASARGLLAVLI